MKRTGYKFRIGRMVMWCFIVLCLLFLYAPLLPPMIRSMDGDGGPLSAYGAIMSDAILMKGIANTALVAGLVAIIAPLLALALAQALRVWRRPRLILALVMLPLFVPGVSMGVATALFFRVVGLEAPLLSIVLVQVLWALPFAMLVIVTTMASFDQVYLEAAHMLGANRLRAFFEVELPQIWPGLMGAAIFSLILSFNETIRTSIVQGGENTVQTYLWSQYQAVGLSPPLYALMTLLIFFTLALVGLLAVMDLRTGSRAK